MKFCSSARVFSMIVGLSLGLALGLQAGRVVAASASIAAGAAHTCELTVSGRVFCWGDNAHGQIGNGAGILPALNSQTVPAEIAAGFTSLAAGGDHSCGLQADGTAFCWGDNDTGQLGNGTTDANGTGLPVRVVSSIKFKSLTAGWDHTCGLDAAGVAYCWGSGNRGQLGINFLGNGQQASALVPTRVVMQPAGQLQTVPTFVALAAGWAHTCGITTSGQVLCWGDNEYGQTGLSSSDQFSNVWTCYLGLPCIPQPTVLPGVLNAKIIAAGTTATCISTTTETYCWGSTVVGGVSGVGPQKQTGISGLTSLSVGDNSACGTDAAGELYCWGAGTSGELGNGVPVPPGSSPVPPALIAGVQDYTSVTVGKGFACGLGAGGAVRCWGAAALGQSGTNSLFGVLATRPLPTPVNGISLKGIWAGEAHICGTGIDGLTLCWGFNNRGQIGHGRAGTVPHQSVVPTPVARYFQQKLIAGPLGAASAQPPTLTNMIGSSALAALHESSMSFVKLTVGTNHTCALSTVGEAYCWGEDEGDQIGAPSATLSACRTPGAQVTCVGSPSHVESAGTQFTQLAAGHSHTCAIATDGKGYCWGINSFGQLGNPNCPIATCVVPTPGLIEFSPVVPARLISIAARSETACAVTNQSRAFCWGAGFGGVPKPIGGPSFDLAASDGEHTCIIRSKAPRKAGNLECMGINQFGDVGTSSNLPVTALASLLSGSPLEVTLGLDFTCALQGSQGLCWGLNSVGQLGVGAAGNLNSPHPLASAAGKLTSLGAGDEHSCALSINGSALCWGDNTSGQLGDGTLTQASQFAVPVPVAASVVLP